MQKPRINQPRTDSRMHRPFGDDGLRATRGGDGIPLPPASKKLVDFAGYVKVLPLAIGLSVASAGMGCAYDTDIEEEVDVATSTTLLRDPCTGEVIGYRDRIEEVLYFDSGLVVDHADIDTSAANAKEIHGQVEEACSAVEGDSELKIWADSQCWRDSETWTSGGVTCSVTEEGCCDPVAGQENTYMCAVIMTDKCRTV